MLKAELAGMDPDDIQIEVEDNVLTLKGERRFEEEVEDERYYRVERRFGSFQRSLALPQGVKADEIQAGYEDGILTVTVPKAEEEKPKTHRGQGQEDGRGRPRARLMERTAPRPATAAAWLARRSRRAAPTPDATDARHGRTDGQEHARATTERPRT